MWWQWQPKRRPLLSGAKACELVADRLSLMQHPMMPRKDRLAKRRNTCSPYFAWRPRQVCMISPSTMLAVSAATTFTTGFHRRIQARHCCSALPPPAHCATLRLAECSCIFACKGAALALHGLCRRARHALVHCRHSCTHSCLHMARSILNATTACAHASVRSALAAHAPLHSQQV